MKKFVPFVVIFILLFSGCARFQTQPPPGCEDAVSYKIPGFVPYGPGIIRLGVVGACAVRPEAKPGVIFGLKISYAALQDQMPRTYILSMIGLIKPFAVYVPKVATLLDKAEKYFSDNDLTTCDRDILASLAQNIYYDLTGQDIWVETEQ